MLASKLYCPTLRDDPAEAEVASHKYMLKAGMIRKNASGFYSFLPLARRSVLKIEKIIRRKFGKNRDVGMYTAKKCLNWRIGTGMNIAWPRRMKN